VPAPPTSASLETRIRDAIRRDGPVPVDRFIERALLDPEHGYYRRREALGAAGDFVTAPEISQMFGEIVGLWLAQAWLDLDRPAPVQLVELGPGRGTLLADVMRVGRGAPGFVGAVTLRLVEASPVLRARQREHLAAYEPSWVDALDDVPTGPMLLIANEFLDALPVRQLVRTDGGWVERRVGLEGGRLGFVVDAERAVEPPLFDAPLGTITEVSPARDALVDTIARRLTAHPGVGILIDYGAVAEGPTGDTLQAVRGHQRADPLAAPGAVDLSSQVDFGALGRAARAAGARVFGPVPQGTFLRAFGIEARAARLLARAAAGQQRPIRQALFRLTDPSQMGEVFKVMVISSPDGPLPPGFQAESPT
jgi:NADH dehydrogenase [ubiquinone] 1 alpha subcomplex assembly factor 7